MNFWENLNSALQSLFSNKMRSLLTMLGIIIGISSVILLSSLGKGGQEKITGDMKKTGYGNFKISVDNQSDDYRKKYDLEEKEVEILKESGEFEAVSGVYSSRLTMTYDNTNLRVNLSGTTEDYEVISPVTYTEGRDFLPLEYEDFGNYITIDSLSANRLFGSEKEAIGKNITITTFGSNSRSFNFVIVGTYENPMASMISVFGNNNSFPSFARIPLKTAERIFSLESYGSIEVKSKNPEKLDESMFLAQDLLERENISGIYETQTTTMNTSSFDSILNTLTIFITAVASISLLVGGIGVMNIMLVSVTERIKEIGIRKALGATNMEILAQFMVEAIILTMFGGFLGIAFGMGGAVLVGNYVDIPPAFTRDILFLSVAISTLIGLVFGVVPARKASLLNPIEALHNE